MGVDDEGFGDAIPGDELAAVARALAELGHEPLPGAVATRLDARLERELGAAPLTARRARRRRVRIGGGLAGATAVAAAIVFALSSGGGGHPARPEAAASGLRTTAASAATDAAAATAPPATKAMKVQAPAAKSCAPASRRGGARPRAGCPGARGGHARAV